MAKKLVGYWKRNKILIRLGFSSYQDYLKSDLWKGIKAKALKMHGHKCKLCRKQTNIIHHTNYGRRILLGKDMRFFVPLCRICHEKVEFSNGIKLLLEQSVDKYKALLAKRRKDSKPQS